MAYPYQGDKTLICPRFGKVVQKIHQGLFQGSRHSHGSVEREEVGKGSRGSSYLQKLKDAIISKPILRLLDLELSFKVHTNASNRTVGGVLVHEGHQIATDSQKLDAAKQRYNTHEKEMNAVIHCLETWKHYLMGTRFTVVIHNVANTFFKTQKKLIAKQARW